jgi:N-acetylglucosamine transport system substrate-binding protein
MSEPIGGKADASDLSRRNMLRGIGLTAFLAVPAAGALWACATSGGGSSDNSNQGPANTGNANNPFGVKDGDPLEVVIFKGGLGDSYATDVHEPMYKKKFPKSDVKHVATQKIAETLQPRFAGGNPPDVVANSGSDLMDNSALQSEGQLLDLTQLFEGPSIDDPSKKVKDTLVPGTVDAGVVAGKPYLLKYVYTAYGLWYDHNLFAKNSWTPAKTFDEFKGLCDKIKTAGLIPYAYAGSNASYYQYWMILIGAAKIGGNQVLIDVDNLVDGVWKTDPILKSATAWAEIGKLYMDKSHEGLRHTEVQLQQNQGKVAFYPSGSWLENEQKKDTPSTFEYAMTPTPSVTGSDKMPFEAIRAAAGEAYFVSAKGKNTAGGLEYLRIMLSKDGAKGFTDKSGNITVVKGATEGLQLSPGNKSVAAAQQAAGDNVVTDNRMEDWYKEMEKELRSQTNALMFGRQSAEQFCDNMQKKADATKADSSITKQHRDK